MCQYGMARNDAQDYIGDPKPINSRIVNQETQTWELIENRFSANKENKGQAPNIFKITSIDPVNSDVKFCYRSVKKCKVEIARSGP